MTILALGGSLRAASSTAALVRATASLAPDGVTVDVYDGLGDLPLFSPDLDADGPPLAVVRLRRRVGEADAVLICTPEYAYGMPGALKNALDWLVSSGELYRKPVAALSASPSARGGDRALAWLRQTLTALDAAVPDAASFAVPFVKQTLDGDRVSDSDLADRLRAALVALGAAG
ncbi:NADPH-dependent FMN reductase [Rubrivirga sp.]|uniref:NADPH-dependent FMN reductase n=1 Tax=Rubrivirga sp. TaxID=1885344 RepID=UPI003B52A208